MALADSVKSFVWGAGGQRLTPEQITVLRALQAKKDKGVDTSPIGSWTQGAARIADAIGDVVQDRRLSAQDKLNQQENSTLLQGLLGQMDGGTPATLPMPTAAGEVAATAPGQATATVPQNSNADYIRSGLISRGFTPQVADGFLANFQDESGLNAGVNEANPIVPGSRGGFGLYQLTGPRRTAYEAFAKQQGKDPADVDAQLDFLKYETQGPEAAAAQTFLNAPDTATAAQAIVNNFLRPAPEHRASRAAAYAGLPSVQTAPIVPVEVASLESPLTATDASPYTAPPPPMTAPRNVQQPIPTVQGARLGQAPNINQAQFDDRFGSPQQFNAASPDMVAASLLGNPSPSPQALAQAIPQQVAPAALAPQVSPQAAPQQVAQAAPPQNNRAIIQALTSPYANEQTRSLATLLFQNQQKQAQAEAEAQRQAQDPMRQLQIQKLQAEVAAAQDPNSQVPDSVRALDIRAQRAGLQPGTPEYAQFFQTQGARTPATYAAPPAGYMYQNDQSGSPVGLIPIPGGPADTTLRDVAKEEARDTTTSVVTNAADRARAALNAPGLPATGTASNLLSGIGETNAAELRRQIGPLRAIASFETLNQLRAASPTGGALGSVTESEHKLLQDKAGALDPSSPNFARDLDDYEKTVLQIVHGNKKGDEIYNQTRKVEKKAEQGAESAPEGVDPILWQHMMPEEKKLWQ